MQLRKLFNSAKSKIHSVEFNSYFNNVPGKRFFTDKSKTIDSKSKQIMIKSTVTRHGFVTRRVRPGDVARVLRYMREQSRKNWPETMHPPQSSLVVLNDFVARILAQGHSMLTEQLEMPYSWTRIRGLALAAGYTPWDATTLDLFSRCVKSLEARKLLEFSAHCLRAPALHEKYKVRNVLQVILIVPENQDSGKIADALIKGTLRRGRDAGFPLVRFDANTVTLVKTLEDMKLKKEWQMNYKVLPTRIIERKEKTQLAPKDFKRTKQKKKELKSPFVAVFSTTMDKTK